jgi:hypothetical protein
MNELLSNILVILSCIFLFCLFCISAAYNENLNLSMRSREINTTEENTTTEENKNDISNSIEID